GETQVRERSLAPYRGAVYKNVDAAELLDRGTHQRIDIVGIGDVGHDRFRLAAGSDDIFNDGVGLSLRTARIHDHRRTRARKIERHGTPDVAGCSGHQGDPPFQFARSIHPCSPEDAAVGVDGSSGRIMRPLPLCTWTNAMSMAPAALPAFSASTIRRCSTLDTARPPPCSKARSRNR